MVIRRVAATAPGTMLPFGLSRSTQATAWGLFAALDLATRWAVYEDFTRALQLTVFLTPVVLVLAKGLGSFYHSVNDSGRITPTTFLVAGMACLIAASLTVMVAMVLRVVFDSPMPDQTTAQELRISGFYFFMIYLSFSFIQFSLAAESARRQQERRAAKAEADALRAELQRLRLQLDPHFLLNALNGILDEITRDRDLARQVLEDLTSFLRHALLGRDQLVTSVGEEIDAISAYLGVQFARFGDGLEADLDVDAIALPRPIVSFLLQPLVENAIEHGREGRKARVSIVVRPEAESLFIEVRNPIHPHGRLRKGMGVGLETVRARLALHYPDRHQFTLHEADGQVIARMILEGVPCSAP